MNTYKFANLPDNSSVDFGVTALVSVWFLLAGAAIIGDSPSVYSHRSPAVAAKSSSATQLAMAPRTTITVVGRRSAAL